MANKPKDPTPHGPYTWGNGPKPKPKGPIGKLINWISKKNGSNV